MPNIRLSVRSYDCSVKVGHLDYICIINSRI